MTDATMGRGQGGPDRPTADEQLLHELTERVRAGELRLTGEGGLLGKLTKMVIEGALEGVSLAPTSSTSGSRSRGPSSRPRPGHPSSDPPSK